MHHILRNLSRLTLDEITDLIRKTPKEARILELSMNFLGYRSPLEVETMILSMPAWITHLDLGVNFLNFYSSIILSKLFLAIPSHIVSLDLYGNQLFYGESYLGLSDTFATFRLSKMRSLGLGYTGIQYQPMSDIAPILTILPDCLEYLDCRGNGLNSLSSADWRLFTRALPIHLKKLDLSENGLHRMDESWITSLSTLFPEGLIIDIGWHEHPVMIKGTGVATGLSPKLPSLYGDLSADETASSRRPRNTEESSQSISIKIKTLATVSEEPATKPTLKLPGFFAPSKKIKSGTSARVAPKEFVPSPTIT